MVIGVCDDERVFRNELVGLLKKNETNWNYFIFTGMVLIDTLLLGFATDLITQNPYNKSAKIMETVLAVMIIGMIGEIVLLIATIKEKDQYKNYHALNQ